MGHPRVSSRRFTSRRNTGPHTHTDRLSGAELPSPDQSFPLVQSINGAREINRQHLRSTSRRDAIALTTQERMPYVGVSSVGRRTFDRKKTALLWLMAVETSCSDRRDGRQFLVLRAIARLALLMGSGPHNEPREGPRTHE